QRHAGDAEAWRADADIVISGDGGASAGATDGALVTVGISALGHGGADDRVDLPQPGLPARSGSPPNHRHLDRAPLTVAGDLGEYLSGAFAALGACSAWWRASRTGVAELVDVSMLEAMQMTFVTTPTLMARFPGGRAGARRWVMIPGNEPT